MNDPTIVFEDIESPRLRLQLREMMEEMIQLAPSDAACFATFRQLSDSFVAEVKFASESAYMQVADQTAAVADLILHVKEKLLTQIVDWRNHRFAS